MALVAGVDGCRGGWIAALRDGGASDWTWEFVPAIADLFDRRPAPRIVAIDMPIGFADVAEPGGRACEREARAILGRPRSSSVFATPARATLAATDYRDALRINRTTGPAAPGLSLQAWHLVPKLRELDGLLRGHPTRRRRVFEAHPELAFARLNDGVGVALPKRRIAGRVARLELLARAGFGDVPKRWEETRRDRGWRATIVAADDAIDALVLTITATRIAAGEAIALPPTPPRDRHGLPMAIRY